MDFNKAVSAVKVIKGNEAFNEALLKEPPRPFSWRAITISFFHSRDQEQNCKCGPTTNSTASRASGDLDKWCLDCFG
jgi:hypothetical protein